MNASVVLRTCERQGWRVVVEAVRPCAMAILVTGVAGFIGAHVAKALLARGDTVVGIDNLNDYYDPALKAARLEWVGNDLDFEKVDLSDEDAVMALGQRHDIEGIVHLGAQAGVRHSIEAPDTYVQSNLVGQLNLLELARSVRPRHTVYASSSSVYGGNDKFPFSEGDRVDRPVSFYAATKRAGELMAVSYAHLYGLPLTGLRFFTVYGPWGRPDMAAWKFVEAIERGEPVTLYDADNQARDFTFIDDIVRGVLAALDRPAEGHALYNLGGDAPVRLRDFLAAIERATGRKAAIIDAPAQPGDVSRTAADIAAARRELGFAPTTTIDEGVKAFVDWYRTYTSSQGASV